MRTHLAGTLRVVLNESSLTRHQRRLLDLVGGHFVATSQWPVLRALQRALEREGENLDLAHIAAELDEHLVRVGRSPDSTIRLTFRGVLAYDPTRGDATNLVKLVELAYRRWVAATEETAYITAAEIAAELGLDRLSLRRLLRIVDAEPGITGSGVGDADDERWRFEISDNVTAFRDVHTIEGYLAAKDARYRYEPPLVTAQKHIRLLEEQLEEITRRRSRFARIVGWVVGSAVFLAVLAAAIWLALLGPAFAFVTAIAIIAVVLTDVLGMTGLGVARASARVATRVVEGWLASTFGRTTAPSD